MEKYLNLEYLKSQGKDPAWFGLGFIQLKLNANQRMHFWHPSLMKDVPDEELHDHRYDFTSHVLVGQTTHEVWDFISDEKYETGPYDVVETNCKPGQPENPTVIQTGDIKLNSSYTMVAGSQYSIHKDMFHRIKATNCVTFLERGPVAKDVARVIRNRENPFVCPFSNPKPVDELWTYIDECINGIPDGYHRTKITKGTVGESSKILEEALELIDAELQNNKVMALVELSDLIGAVQHYVERRYGSLLSLEDLQIMAKTTRRAFEQGRR